jgi:hypothetical protein
MVKQNNRMPVISVEIAMVYFRPIYLTSTVYAAIIDPGTPTIEVMA